jgi:hypothetical protein
METFNKYSFMSNLEDYLINEIEIGNDTDIQTLIHEYIDNECIYTADCWDICAALGATDFTAFDMPCNTINQLAYCALYELCNEELDLSQVQDLYNEKFNQ